MLTCWFENCNSKLICQFFRTKAEPSYLPKPLRTKKAATKRDQMKRSRSLQSSPLRGGEEEPYVNDGEGRRGRSRSQSGKQPRSSSLKPTGSSKKRYEDKSSVNASLVQKLLSIFSLKQRILCRIIVRTTMDVLV